MRRLLCRGLVLGAWAAVAGTSAGTALAQDAPAASERRVVRGMHDQILFQKDVSRIAVGDDKVLKADVLNSRSILLLGKATGRTSLLVWYSDDSLQSFVVSVSPDLDMLQRALREIHPNIAAEIAPDRDAVVLRGIVPDITYSDAAASAANSYLRSGRDDGGAPLVAATAPDGGAPSVRGKEHKSGESSVINLIRVEKLPRTVEERLKQSFNDLGAHDVLISRLVRGDTADDAVDVLLLRGKVKNQVELMRVLQMSATMLLGGADTSLAIKVLGDESGGVAVTDGQRASEQNSTSLSGVGTSSGFNGEVPESDLALNPARAKSVSIGNGRILSFIEVTDLPQVRVDVRLYEINRTKLMSYAPQFTMIWGDIDQNALLPSGQAAAVQGTNAQRVGAGESDVQNVLGFLADGYNQHFQMSGDNVAIDAVLNILESRGIARTLSNPSLTVLSGESASFQVGGEVPVPQAFSPSVGTATGGTNSATPGVFSSVEFRPFGVNLAMRPMVGEDDKVTISMSSVVDEPDAVLTTAIRETTGTDPSTTAFASRSIQTTARLADGQALMIGGLIGRRAQDGASYTPGLERIPVIGWLFKRYTIKDEDRELVVVVTPTVVRDRIIDLGGWSFPDVSDSARAWVDTMIAWSQERRAAATAKAASGEKVSGD